MATTALQGNPVNTSGDLPSVGSQAPAFTLVGADLGEFARSDYANRRIILNIFPSVDTGVCAQSVRTFNQKAAGLDNTTVVCASRDLPFALGRFCAAEGIENVIVGSDFRDGLGGAYGLTIVDGPMSGLLARCVIVIDTDGTVKHVELVDDITHEPDYEAALAALA